VLGSERVRGEFVSGNYFAVLGAHSWIGRLICESDEQSIDGAGGCGDRLRFLEITLAIHRLSINRFLSMDTASQ
jgi:hypothetical protein